MKPGDEIAGRYRLEELRGRGAMSEVWRAHDERLDRTVALKLLAKTADLDRFRREARAVAALAHENVMRVYDYGEDAAGPFMALEWLEGGTLEDRLDGGALPTTETEYVARDMAAGLAHLHARGFVHRDLKPANVLFDEEGRAKLADLGLARIAAGTGTLTEAGTVLGTVAYISPEQATGQPAGPASDVYSFGVILFRMLTGALPFAAADALELIRLHRTAEPPPVESLNPEASPALATLAAAALRKDPAARPADGEALLARLQPEDAGEETQILAPGAVPVTARPRRTAALAALLLVLALAGAALAWAVTRPDAPAAAHGSSATEAVLGARKSRHRVRTASTFAGTTRATTQARTRTRRTHSKHHTRPATTTVVRTTTHSTTTAPPPTTTAPPPTTTAPPPTTTATTTTVPTTTATAP